MSESETLALRKYFSDAGFNLMLSVRSDDYDSRVSGERASGRLLPSARTIILAGFGGKEFWGVLQSYLDENLMFRESTENIIDDYTRIVFDNIPCLPGREGSDYIYSFPLEKYSVSLDFMALGEACGAGVRSILGILIHPVYGPWISMRGAIVADMELERYDGSVNGYNPCPSCSKPCINACPAKTVSENGWDWRSCMEYRLGQDECDRNCSSRRACPEGSEHQYTEEQLFHHHRFVIKNARKYIDTLK